MNAISKGVSIGKYKKGRDDGMEASRSGSQPYVELMGRRYAPTSVQTTHVIPCELIHADRV